MLTTKMGETFFGRKKNLVDFNIIETINRSNNFDIFINIFSNTNNSQES